MKDVIKFAVKLFIWTVAVFTDGKLVKNSLNSANCQEFLRKSVIS